MYKCSECRRPVGVMLGRDGRPELFKCHVTGRAAETVPKMPIVRITPPRRSGLRDLSRQQNRRTPIAEEY